MTSDSLSVTRDTPRVTQNNELNYYQLAKSATLHFSRSFYLHTFLAEALLQIHS